MTLSDVVEIAGSLELLALLVVLLATVVGRQHPARLDLAPGVTPGRAEAREAA